MKPELNKRYKLSNEHLGTLKGVWGVKHSIDGLTHLESDSCVHISIRTDQWQFEEVDPISEVADEIGVKRHKHHHAGYVINKILDKYELVKK